MKYKVGDKVRVRIDLVPCEKYGSLTFLDGSMSKCAGQICTIKEVLSGKKYHVSENPFGWSEEMLEPAAPTLAEIKEKKLTCVVHAKTKREADMLFKAVDSYDHNGKTWASWWNEYKEKTCYRINLGEAIGYGCMDDYIENGEDVVEFSDLVATGGYCNGFRGGKIPTPEKPVSIEEQLFGLPKGASIHDLPTSEGYKHFTVVKDEIDALEHMANNVCTRVDITDFDAQRLAKRLADISTRFKKRPFNISTGLREEKNLKFTFYVTEGYRIDKSNSTRIPTMTTEVLVNGKDYQYGGSATCDKTDYSEREGVLNAIANAVCGGNFDREFNKVIKNKAFADKKARTCAYCGKVLDTVEEKQAEEAWHVERKKARRERYLLRKRAKEIAFEEQAQKMAKEIIAEDNKK